MKKYKTGFLLLLCLCAVALFCVFLITACSDSDDNDIEEEPVYDVLDMLSFELKDDGTYKVSCSDDYENISYFKDINIPSYYNEKAVTSIGNFTRCRSLKSITVPDTVISVGEGAFNGCRSLASITLPFAGNTLNGENNTHFGYIFGAGDNSENSQYVPKSLKTVIITGGTSIGEGAFYGCTSITSLTLPFVGNTLNGESNTHFGYIFGAGSDSDNPKYVPETLKTVIITGGSAIGNYAFYNCASLTNVVLPDSVTSIGQSAFHGCNLLVSAEMGDGVTSIGKSAFLLCYSLTSVVIPDSVKEIGGWAFYTCRALTSLEIGDGVTSIGEHAFANCNSLKSVEIKDIANWCKISFEDVYANPLSCAHNLYLNGKLLTEITIPDSVTSIGDYAFCVCDSLTSIVIPDSVTSIGNDVFFGCRLLTIYCEEESKPSGWSDYWNPSELPVVWGYKG